MKKLFIVVLLVLSLFCSCTANSDENEAESEKVDWRNTIEYEGSFYVSKEKKFLYSLDKGTVILWENSGNGSVFQTLDFETSVQNATDRFETEDVNGDGYSDIRIIYSEGNGLLSYNLWLWSEKDEKFAECRDYRLIYNPESSDGGVVSQITREFFGSVVCKYSFTEDFSLQLDSFSSDTAEDTAGRIAASLFQGSAELCEGEALICENTCPVFAVKKDGENAGFIAYSKDNVWYADKGTLGCYRIVVAENGEYFAGDYTDEAKSVCDTLKKLHKSDYAEIIATNKGTMNSKSAVKYTVDMGEKEIFVVSDKDGRWYYSEDGGSYCYLRYADAALGDSVNFLFE